MPIPDACPTCQAELVRIFQPDGSRVDRVECLDADEHVFAIIGEGADQRLEPIEPTED